MTFALFPLLKGWDYNPELPPPTERIIKIKPGQIKDISIIKYPGLLQTISLYIKGPGDGSGKKIRFIITKPFNFDVSPEELYKDYGYVAPGDFYKIYLDKYDETNDEYTITITCPAPGLVLSKEHVPVHIRVDTRFVNGEVTIKWWIQYIGIINEEVFKKSIREVLGFEYLHEVLKKLIR